MGRRSKTTAERVEEDGNGDGGVATAIGEAPETMFPELEDTPETKELMSAAKHYYKVKGERETLLSTSKEKVDGAMAKVIALMHQCKVKKFKHKKVSAELIETKEKVEVEIEDEEDGE